MLLKGSNVKPAVINYFDNLSVPDLIKIMDIAEEHDLNQLKTFVVGTFAQVNTIIFVVKYTIFFIFTVKVIQK